MNEYKKKSFLNAILFLIWFIVSVAAMLVPNTDGYTILMLLGQSFAVFGCLFFFDKSGLHRSSGTLLFLTGIGCLVIGAFNRFGTESIRIFFSEHTGYIGLTVLFIFVLYWLVSGWLLKFFSALRCTDIVNARIVDIHIFHHLRAASLGSPKYNRTTGAPVYEAFYKGEMRKWVCTVYTPLRYTVGAFEEIKVNPNKPEEFCCRNMIFFRRGVFVIALASLASLSYAMYRIL